MGLSLTLAPASAGDDEGVKSLAAAREAAKAGDFVKAKEICGDLLKASPRSLAIRFEIAQLAEIRKDSPTLAHEHYAEIAAAGERAAKLKEKLSDEESKLVKEAAAKAKIIPDAYAKELSKALKTYADAVLKTARMARTKKHWSFTAEIGRNVKTLYNGLPGVLDPKDPREAEAMKNVTDGNSKRGEDKTDVPSALKAEVSEAVAALGKDLVKISDAELDVYTEVRGPYARRRALMPLGILIALQNDPAGNAKKSEAVWEKAHELEPTITSKLRFATDASKWFLRVNGKMIAASDPKNLTANYREVDVALFRDANVVSYFGHEIADKGRRGRPEWVSRAWVFVDIPLTEKTHLTTDDAWRTVAKPPVGWDYCMDGSFDTFPVTVASKDLWDYERTKTWTGFTVIGDPGDTYLRRVFDLPAGVPDPGAAPKTEPDPKANPGGDKPATKGTG
jgi:hypothetical protein